MVAAPSLRDLQLWMQSVIVHPQGASEALRLPQNNKFNVEIISGSESLRESRLSVYAEGYFFRILESLKANFPRTAKILGDSRFSNLVVQYLKKFPSRFTSIEEIGSRLPGFLSNDFLDHTYPEWLKDLALFEWNLIESFYAHDTKNENPSWFTELISNSDYSQVIFNTQPALRLQKSPWDFCHILNDTEEDQGEIEKIKNSETYFCIYRNEDEVFWETVPQPLFLVLESLRDGQTLTEALNSSTNLEPALLSEGFAHWVNKKILNGIKSKEIS
jgi:hypothetical protein